jgi:2,4'-dihydroxyacetophenone dioxygenase
MRQQHHPIVASDIGVIPFMLATVISLLPPLRAVPASPRPAASRHGASGMLTGLEPTSWQAWSLQDVGLFDGAAFALAASAVYATSRQEDDSVANHEDSKLRDEAAARVREAERAVEQSVLASPCNGPNPELLAELEAADQAAQRLSRSAAPTSDPFELPSAFEMPTWRQPKSTQRRGQAPRMMAAPPEALGEIVIGDIASTDDERLWVPQTECLSFRPLTLCVSQGYYVNLLRFVGGGTLGCHRHSSPVHAHTIKGTWGYKEHAWTAGPGTYVFEPPGETHTLVVGEDEMIALFHVTGALLYCDPKSPETIIGFDDVFTKLEKARKHYEAVGLGADFADQFLR